MDVPLATNQVYGSSILSERASNDTARGQVDWLLFPKQTHAGSIPAEQTNCGRSLTD